MVESQSDGSQWAVVRVDSADVMVTCFLPQPGRLSMTVCSRPTLRECGVRLAPSRCWHTVNTL